MGILKKILANCSQALTDSEKTQALENLGISSIARFPPGPGGIFYPRYSVVVSPDDGNIYLLLDEYHHGDTFANLRKVQLGPVRIGDPLKFTIDADDIGTTKSGLMYDLDYCYHNIGLPYIELTQNGNVSGVLTFSRYSTDSYGLGTMEFTYVGETSDPTKGVWSCITVNTNNYIDSKSHQITWAT